MVDGSATTSSSRAAGSGSARRVRRRSTATDTATRRSRRDEAIPWSARRLIIGTGASGALPVMPELLAEAARRGVEVVSLPTAEACALLADVPDDDLAAILHVTC